MAMAVMQKTGEFVKEVLTVIATCTGREMDAGTVETTNSYTLPASMVFNSAVKAGFPLCASDKVTGSSVLLTTRSVRLSLVGWPATKLNVAQLGMISIGFQTVPRMLSPI